MDIQKTSVKVASDITVFTKYSRYIRDLKRRETFSEIVKRNKEMHIKKFPFLKESIDEAYKFVYEMKVLPSMRSLQFAGPAIEHNPARMYNCCALPIDSYHSFSEVMFLLLGGSGVGYSVMKRHINKLPKINKSLDRKRFLISDSIEGWADAVKALMKWSFGLGYKPMFDYSEIRPKGADLITSGGKAPGPEPLKKCLKKITEILERKKNGTRLSTLEVHDILCFEADAVRAGGIRRAALICLFDEDDHDMLTCKSGTWWEDNPQRGRANNSVVLSRDIDRDSFMDIWKKVEDSKAGEPGFYFTNNKDWLTNPCVEISLEPFQFCNLVEVNVSDISSEEDLFERVSAASFIATLQASYTDFHYLRPIWRETTEKGALIGVGMTGIASGEILKYDLKKAAEIVKFVNSNTSSLIGINPAERTTCVKPSGSSSLVLGTSSGIHAWHSKYYIRRMRLGKNEPLGKYLMEKIPGLVEDNIEDPNEIVVSIPQKSPEGAITRVESAIDLLERVKKFNTEWVHGGHVKGSNTNNVSCTINVRENEWEEVGNWMYDNRDSYNGIAVFPFDGGTYRQAPFEECSKEVYEELLTHLKTLDLRDVIEEDDSTDLMGEVACAGGVCEI